MNEPFELLGSSQTFLGVLVTIIILFIIEDKTNLITYILKEIGLKLKDQIEALTITTSLDKSVLQSSNYKLLRYFMDKDDVDEGLHEEGAGLLANISTERAKFQVKYINVENKDLTILDKIVGAKEILLAPLYTLFFTITIFIFDELFRFRIDIPNNLMFSTLSCFIVLSYAFWTMLWFKYFFKFSKFDKLCIRNTKTKKSVFSYIRTVNRKKKIGGSCVFIILALAILHFINAYIINVSPFIIIGVGIIIPFATIGIFMLKFINGYSDYSYAFMCGHYIMILLLSVIVVCSYYLLLYILKTEESALIQYQSLTILKISVFVFTLLNGIILPFVFPYIAYYRYYEYVKAKTGESRKEANDIINSINNDLEDFVRKIPSPR